MALENYEIVIRMSQLASTKDRNGLLPLSPATVWRLVANPKSGFPQPFKLGPKMTVWSKAEVLDWVSKKGQGVRHD